MHFLSEQKLFWIVTESIILCKTCDIFCKVVEMVVRSQLCSTLLCMCLFMNLFYMSDKKKQKNKRWKGNIVIRTFTEFGDEWILSINMINRCLYILTKLFVLFCPIQRKVAQLVFWLLLEKCLQIATSKLAEINSIQKPRLHLGYWYVSCRNYFYLHQTRAFFLCTFFSRTPCAVHHL